MQNKNEGNENKIILGDLNCNMGRSDRDGEKKTQDFIGAIPITVCQNSWWIMGLKIYGEERTQILLSSSATIGSLAKTKDRDGLCWYKNC